MAKEIEKKFHIKKLPNLSNFKKVGIKQWYLSNEGDYITNRLKLYDNNSCIFEIKKGTFFIRDEISFNANIDDFKDMIKYSPFLEKDRYFIEESETLEIVLDVFKGNLDGLYILKVEGKGHDGFNEVFNWKPPWDWVGEEIEDIEYLGIKLAQKNMINKKDENKLIKIINDVIREDLREEALSIIKNMDDKSASEIIMYYNDNNFNAVCLHFDFVKKQLVDSGIMTQNENDEFGHGL